MRGLSRHLPLLMLTAILLLGAVACGDEPSGKHHGTRVDPTPVDTTHHNDTTGTHGSDTTGNHNNDTTTTPPFTIVIDAPRSYGYSGDTLQLTAVTSSPADVTWRSTRTAAATVNGSGTVLFNNVIRDDSTLIIASANGVSDTVVLTNRCWEIAAWQDNAWNSPAYFAAHRGDTVCLTIVDSHANPIDDHGFNASSCQWSVNSRNADISTVIAAVATPSPDNSWQYRLTISGDAPAGAIIMVFAQHGDAAMALSITITP